MAWSRSRAHPPKDVWSMEESAKKRRKVEVEQAKTANVPEENDDWDDGLELTQAELETLDVVASQAIDTAAPGDNTARQTSEEGALAEAANELMFFAKPFPTPLTFSRRSTSSSSGSSAQPASLSARSASDTGGSLSSHSSENGKTDASSDTIHALRTRLQQELKKAEDERFRSAGEMTFLRETLRKQEAELERVRGERDDVLEKERLAQKENEKTLQAKLGNLYSESQFKEQEFKNLQEQLQSVQLKLKAFEQEKPGSTKSDPPSSPASKVISPKKIPVRPSPPSKMRLKQLEDLGSQGKSFPTRHTFMEQTSAEPMMSPRKRATANQADINDGVKISCVQRKRRLKLRMSQRDGGDSICTGPQVVQQLFATPATGCAVSPATDGQMGSDLEPGLLGLMHAMSTTLRITGLNYSRGKHLSPVSPIKPKKQTMKRLTKDENKAALSIVSKEHFQLAVEGLMQLLEDRPEITANSSDRMLNHLKEVLRSTESLNSQANTSDHSKPKSQKENAGSERLLTAATLLLPLLADYVQHYVDLLSSIAAGDADSGGVSRLQWPSVSPRRSGAELAASSSSLETSSLDTLSTSSSMLQLLRDGHIYATSIEAFATSALRIVSLLLHLCPGLAVSILVPLRAERALTVSTAGNTSTGYSSSAAENDGKSEMEADDEKSTSSSEIRILAANCSRSSSLASGQQACQPSGPHSPRLYHLLLNLAGQDLNESGSSAVVMSHTLQTLALLCRSCPKDSASKLESITARGILTSCLEQTSHVPVIVWALRLLQAVARHSALISKLCSKSENCVMYLMHRVITKEQKATPAEMSLYWKEYITCLSSIVAQRQGLQLLLSSCSCSQELVPGIVLSLYKLYQIHRQSTHASSKSESNSKPPLSTASESKSGTTEHRTNSNGLLWQLGQGITVLHAVAQADSAFVQHHAPVQLQFVSLLSGLRATLLADQSYGWDFHLSALEELCDFEPDLNELSSQETESGDQMDQT